MIINEPMETYFRLVLLLFHPYGQASDIILNQSHTLCLRSAIMHCLIGDEQKQFLQNLQDSKSNGLRVTRIGDDLQRCTTSFHPANNIFNSAKEEEEENEDDEMQGQHLNDLLHMLEIEAEDSDSSQNDATTMGDLPKQMNLEYTKQKGTLNTVSF
jgi:hypothetical protein